MGLIPFCHLTIQTPLDKKEIKHRLSENMAPIDRYLMTTNKPFEGKLTEDGFEMMRVFHTRDLYVPVVVGKISSDSGGSEIEIRMRLHWIVMLFMIIFLGGIGTFAVSQIPSSIISHQLTAKTLFPIMLFFGLYLACIVNFQKEASYVKVFVTKMVDPKLNKHLPRIEDDWQEESI